MHPLATQHRGTAPTARAVPAGHRAAGPLVILLVVALGIAGCTSPLEQGELRYQEGDRLGALETWRRIEPNSSAHPEAQQRIGEVEAEFDQLVLRYAQRGRYFAEKGRLAESVLNYRLALRLQPDAEILTRVQRLVRVLATRRETVHARFRERFEAGDLSAARSALQDLRELDPFWPGAASDERALQAAWNS